MSASAELPNHQSLSKESIFLIALLLEILMTKNGFRDQPYTKEDIDDTMESLSKYKLEWLSELSAKIRRRKSYWVRQNIFRITIQQGIEPALTIELSNFLRINYFENFVNALGNLTNCSLIPIGKHRFAVSP